MNEKRGDAELQSDSCLGIALAVAVAPGAGYDGAPCQLLGTAWGSVQGVANRRLATGHAPVASDLGAIFQ